MTRRAGKKLARLFRRVEYPEYASPIAGIIGQHSTQHTKTNTVSILSQLSQPALTLLDSIFGVVSWYILVVVCDANLAFRRRSSNV